MAITTEIIRAVMLAGVMMLLGAMQDRIPHTGSRKMIQSLMPLPGNLNSFPTVAMIALILVIASFFTSPR